MRLNSSSRRGVEPGDPPRRVRSTGSGARNPGQAISRNRNVVPVRQPPTITIGGIRSSA